MTRTVFTLAAGLLLCGAVAGAQPNLDAWLWVPGPDQDACQIYFDASVDCAWGGTLESPGWWTWQLGDQLHAYLILSDPSAAVMTGWAAETELVGECDLLDIIDRTVPFYVGDSVDDVVHHHYLLREWIILNPQRNVVRFHVRPDPLSGQTAPGYYDGSGQFVAMHHPIGDRWDFDRPIMGLNDFVSPAAARSWGEVKALYR